MFWTFLLPTLFRIWHFYCSKLAHSLLRKGANKRPNCVGTGDNENGASGKRSERRGNPEEDPAPHEAFGKEEAGSTAEYKLLSKQKNKALIKAEIPPKDFTAVSTFFLLPLE